MITARLRDLWDQRRADDRGVVAGSDVLFFGLLAFVVGSMLIINVWAVIDASFATSAASREGARVFVESADAGTAQADARQTINAVMSDYGRNDTPVRINIAANEGFTRCAVVSVTVEYDVPFIQLPGFGSFGSLTTVESAHSERVDAYRSGDFIGDCG